MSGKVGSVRGKQERMSLYSVIPSQVQFSTYGAHRDDSTFFQIISPTFLPHATLGVSRWTFLTIVLYSITSGRFMIQ